MNVTVLTSSRADFGIQLPLLRVLEADPDVQLSLIAFGSHGDTRYGHTLDEVRAQGFTPAWVLPPVLDTDDPAGITAAMGRTMEQFTPVWRAHPTDMIVALGDRYEMFAAVASALPFGLPVTHLHGGETTLGAIDNALRHAITHMSRVHCTGAEPYRQRVAQLLGHERHVHHTGVLSIDNLRSLALLDVAALRERFGVDLSSPTVLVTFHPETVSTGEREAQWQAFSDALRVIGARYRVLVTLPNADTHGMWLRERWAAFLREAPFATGVDSLGTQGYLSCMQHCAFMLGNTSSGYVEASWFPKWVIDVGERQTGRLVTPNIVRCPIGSEAILHAVEHITDRDIPNFGSPYGDGHAAERILAAIKSFA
jgi:GDP/UDP-N,N'-diacetylbacillosamine 2-epimerase (hydrolysing)